MREKDGRVTGQWRKKSDLRVVGRVTITTDYGVARHIVHDAIAPAVHYMSLSLSLPRAQQGVIWIV